MSEADKTTAQWLKEIICDRDRIIAEYQAEIYEAHRLLGARDWTIKDLRRQLADATGSQEAAE